MLALAVTFATALAAAPSASVTCADGPASCDSAWAAPTAFAADRQDEDDGADPGPPEYATPVEIDCSEPAPAAAALASGECDEAPVAFWYRVSRYPESELPAGHLTPASPHRARGAASVAGGAPDVGQITRVTVQPVALAATTAMLPAVTRRLEDTHTQALPARALAPPDRPPRV
jgi:hypothetical protein